MRNRRGFTLIELLEVIAIIGAPIAPLLPAVPKAREAARRIRGTTNPKPPGIATHDHRDALSTLPFGAAVSFDRSGPTHASLTATAMPGPNSGPTPILQDTSGGGDSVRFIKSTVAGTSWRALGTAGVGEIVSADSS